MNSNGAEKHITVAPAAPAQAEREIPASFAQGMRGIADDLNLCSRKGLSERFDSTIGAGTVLMPFGGRYQMTPIQAMAHLISVEKKHTDDCSLMSWGFNPFLSEKSPYHGAYLAVIESVCKLIATGAKFEDVYLTFQEYFEKPLKDPARWGKPFAALLGAFDAQMNLGIASIGGKDSMSGSFEDIDVPPTLVSFAVTTAKTGDIVSPEFKQAGHKVLWYQADPDENGLPDTESLLALFDRVHSLMQSGKAVACYTPTAGGIADAVLKMALGNRLGFDFADGCKLCDLFSYRYGGFLLEVTEDLDPAHTIGTVTEADAISCAGETVSLTELRILHENKLESVFPCNIDQGERILPIASSKEPVCLAPAVKVARPRVVIPVFPGTNCEYDSAKAFEDAGVAAQTLVINNLTADGISRSVSAFAKAVNESQIVFLPGGFSGGDEPDGSGKFIAAFLRNEEIREAIGSLLDKRDGLMAGICNGFQALIKLGLVPFGKITDTDATCPTLTYNTIGRHQSKIVRVRVASALSPWLKHTKVGQIYHVPISHGEGRFLADDSVIAQLNAAGQIATQYVDLDGNPTTNIRFNPNDSALAIEGITSPDGRVLGKMGHSERWAKGLYQNVLGEYDMQLFRSAAEYFK